MKANSPKLRSVEKYQPEYPLGQFPKGFAIALGREIVYLLATRDIPKIEGEDWRRFSPDALGLSGVHQM